MRLVRVQISGFGRIRSSGFSADRKLTAILGPNEAGKSTLLRALLSLNDNAPLPSAGRNRTSNITDSDLVVEADFALDPADLAEFVDEDWVALPKKIFVRKLAGGSVSVTLDSEPVHRPSVWSDAVGALNTFHSHAGSELAVSDDLPDEVNAARELISETFERMDAQVRARDVSVSFDELAAVSDALAAQRSSSLWDEGDTFQRVSEKMRPLISHPQPGASMQKHLARRVPKFEMFTEEDRQLRHEYPFDELTDGAPRALGNLLGLAGQSLGEVLPNSSRRTAVATAQDAATETLEHVFEHAWKQHPIAVKLGFESDRLILLVRDKSPGGQTIAFDERSDGLRTFVALTAFLATRSGEVPPILLIDEAEARLHWDAQADLIAVLQSSSEVGQILYTTHSPGCLPPDLGTGVIFVQPSKEDANSSTIRRDFWSVQAEDAFGAAPILFMMGASAAAFSRLRKAVVAEGPSDMMLLPTLFRAATKLAELDFQVVPGISTTSKERLAELDHAGVRVAYLVDGDAQGVVWRRQLREDGGVEDARIKSLPEGVAVEDLFDRDFYLGVFLRLADRDEEPSDLTIGPGPLKPQLEELCENVWHVPCPTSVDVADAILSKLDETSPGEPDHIRVKLASGAGPALRRIHKELSELLKAVTNGAQADAGPAA